MATFAAATKLDSFEVSEAVGSTHGVNAINRITGDIAVVYSENPGTGSQTVKCAIFKRLSDVGDLPQWRREEVLELGSPGAALTPSGGAAPSCSHPWIVPVKDGFVVFWERRDTLISNETMTAGGLQIEMVKIKPAAEGSGYDILGPDTPGKGWVLDNTVIAGDAGGTPRAAAYNPRVSNLVAVVYGHHLTYTEVSGTDTQRTYAVRAAYLDFDADGKPSFISGGNRTGGSAVGEAVDGGFAAGATQTYLVTSLDLDSNPTAGEVFASGGGLPHCIFTHMGDLAVSYEVRNGAGGTGGIVFRIYKGPFRASGLDTAAILTDTTSFPAGAGLAARRGMMALRNVRENSLALSGANFPPILMAYGNQTPGASDSGVCIAKTLTFPLNNQATPTPATLTMPVNTNYDGTSEEQTLPVTVDSSFLSCAIVDEKLVNAAGGEGHKFKVVHADGAGEIMFPEFTDYPVRPYISACVLKDGNKLAVLTWEGPRTAAASIEEVFMSVWKFA